MIIININIEDTATQGGNLVRPGACYVQRDPFPCRQDAGCDHDNYDDDDSEYDASVRCQNHCDSIITKITTDDAS